MTVRSGAWDNAQKVPKKLPTTEDGLARVFADVYGDRLKYCYHTGAWFEWDGDIWRREETELAFHLARHLCRDAAEQNHNDKSIHNRFPTRKATATAVEGFAKTDRVFATTSAIWDQDPWLLGTPNGTVDLMYRRAARIDAAQLYHQKRPRYHQHRQQIVLSG